MTTALGMEFGHCLQDLSGMPGVTMDFCGHEVVMKLMLCRLRERSTNGRTFQKLTVLLSMLQPKPDGKFG